MERKMKQNKKTEHRALLLWEFFMEVYYWKIFQLNIASLHDSASII